MRLQTPSRDLSPPYFPPREKVLISRVYKSPLTEALEQGSHKIRDFSSSNKGRVKTTTIYTPLPPQHEPDEKYTHVHHDAHRRAPRTNLTMRSINSRALLSRAQNVHKRPPRPPRHHHLDSRYRDPRARFILRTTASSTKSSGSLE